jgi:hypothetical protein
MYPYNGFYNISVNINEGRRTDNVLCKIFTNASASIPDIDTLIGKINNELKITDLFKFYNNLEFSPFSFSPENLEISKDDICMFNFYLKSYYESILDNKMIMEKGGPIQSVTLHYPFVRCSFVKSAIIVSFFATINYVNGTSELWITESIPNKNDVEGVLKEDDINVIINASVFSPRCSIYNSYSPYYYGDEDKSPNEFSVNYILNSAVKYAFNVDLYSSNRISLLSEKTFDFTIEKTNKKKHEIMFVPEEYIILIAINNRNLEYFQYITQGLSSLFVHECATTLYHEIIALGEEEHISDCKQMQLELFMQYLRSVKRKNHHQLNPVIDMLYKEQTVLKRKDWTLFISEILGKFAKGLIE